MAENIEQKIRGIAQLGRQHYRDGLPYLKKFFDNPERLLSDWYFALGFYFGQTFMRGRRDELSVRFMNNTLRCLDGLLKSSSGTGSSASMPASLKDLKAAGWLDSPLSDADDNGINRELRLAGVNNGHDRLMVIDSLGLLLSIPDNNIVAWSVLEIKNDRMEALDNILQTLHGVGPKLSSLFLQAVVSVFELEDQVSEKDKVRLQPVDIWVKRVGEAIGLLTANLSDQQVRQKIVEGCLQAGVSSVEFNQGAWYIGTHSLELVLSSLVRA